MNTTKNEMITLNDKVDLMYKMLENLNHNVSLLTSNKPKVTEMPRELSGETVQDNHLSLGKMMIDQDLVHKDVLIDSNGLEKGFHYGNERELSPEIQIQRLTAQLTAAYNRIAALEEQLLSRRIHT